MKILCITDQFEGAVHSSIEGIFGGHLREYCDVMLVYFSRDAVASRRDGERIILPYRWKRGDIGAELGRLINLDELDIVIVRNFFPVLGNVLKHRHRHRFRVGFWNSFPHTFRRLFEARAENRAVLRKSIEYAVRTWLEKRLVRRCDFLMAMSPEFKGQFFADVDVPFLPLPMGINFDGLPVYNPGPDPVRRLVYTGAVDRLRQTELIVEALMGLEDEFVFDIYTASNNEVTDRIRKCGDSRIRLQNPLPRGELLQRLTGYDIGIGLIPDNDLYRVSSPTKTLEYYGVGLPAVVNYLPEYRALFDAGSAFFCEFSRDSIREAMAKALAMPREQLRAMGESGRTMVMENRSYKELSGRVNIFLVGLLPARGC